MPLFAACLLVETLSSSMRLLLLLVQLQLQSDLGVERTPVKGSPLAR